MKEYHVYIMSNHSRTLYIGFTSDIGSRVWQHKTGTVKGFTSRYKMDKLVYCETFRSANEAIAERNN